MYAINHINGQLKDLIPSTITTEICPQGITTDPSGKYAYVNSSCTNIITMYSINQDTGMLSPLFPISTITAGISRYVLVFEPLGRYAYLVSDFDRNVSIYSVSAATGVLTFLGHDNLNIPRGIISFDFTGEYAYSASSIDSSVSMLKIDPSTGRLIPLEPSVVKAGYLPLGVAITSTNKYAYVHNIGDNTISMYQLDHSTGKLVPLEPFTIPTGNSGIGAYNPQGVVIDPTNKFLYVTNYQDNNISMYGINQNNGQLTPLNPATISAGKYPKNIVFSKF